MNLILMNTVLSVVKLSPKEEIPSWAVKGEFFSVTRTDEELSIVCPSDQLPASLPYDVESGWGLIKVEGMLDFSLTGILADLANPLAENGISIFALSTYNTDYLLVKTDCIDQAKAVLEKAGHSFR